MARNQTFNRREERKRATEVPVVSDLGPKITMPRKTNRSAARRIAAGDPFWDKRKVERKDRKQARVKAERNESYPVPHRLSRKQRQWIMAHLPGWSWASGSGALIAPAGAAVEHLDDLVKATRLPYVQRAILRLQGMGKEQAEYVAERAPRTVRIVLDDPLEKSSRVVRAPRLR